MPQETAANTQIPASLIPFMLESLGWKRADPSKWNEERWIDPNQPESTPSTSHYAWYVSQLRVQNRTDTTTLKLTNTDLAEITL